MRSLFSCAVFLCQTGERLFTLWWISCLDTSTCGKKKKEQELSGEQMTQMLLIECEFSWFTVGPVPSLDVSVSLLFLYSGENDPRPRRWHASSYSGPSVFQHLLHGTDPLHWGEVKILTVILPQPGVLLHNCRYFNHMSAAHASVHFFPTGSSSWNCRIWIFHHVSM